MTEIILPEYRSNAFHCPLCGVYANQSWTSTGNFQTAGRDLQLIESIKYINVVKCTHCGKHSIWVDCKMVYPPPRSAPLPNEDMPEEVKDDYLEAREILDVSPRGAAALLRLAIQKLCKHLGGQGTNLNDDIGTLVKNGLPVQLQKALDSVRVIGNNSVHPGQIDIRDNVEIAYKLFGFINVICANQITQPKTINDFYSVHIPESIKQNINS